MRVPLEKVPVTDRRRAARMLESLLSSPSRNRRLREAHFGDEVMPIYRPDLDEVAYWEFEVEGIKTVLPISEDEAKEFDRGFILVATGQHDVPLPQFSLDLAPPSRQLEQLGDGMERVVKVDSLCFAAEDARGELIGYIGTMPPRLEPVDVDPTRRSPSNWATTLPLKEEVDRQEDSETTEEVRLRRSRQKYEVKMQPWDSWEQTKEGYKESYGHLLAALAQRAAEPWKIEDLTEEFGEGIESGETYSLPMLERCDWEISGEGAAFVEVELNPQPLPPCLLLTPKAGLEEKDLNLEVTFHYPSGDERLLFFIVPEGAPTTIIPTGSLLGPTFER